MPSFFSRISFWAALFFATCFLHVPVTQAQVVINEVQASNNTTASDEDGDYEDWIELYNAGKDAIPLNSYGLSDTEGAHHFFRWTFPDTTIQPGQYLLIWASGKDRRTPGQPLHTNFSIASEGEPLRLSNIQGERVDSLPPQPVPSDYSIGRYPDGADNWFLFDVPTPGRANHYQGYEGLVRAPAFSQQPGFHREAFKLHIIPQHPEDVIYFTRDGSKPTTDDSVYSAPIQIDRRDNESNELSTIRTSPHISWGKPLEPVFKGQVIRAMAARPGYRKSETATGTWFVDPQGCNRYSFPVISIVADSMDLFSDEKGLMVPGHYYSPHPDSVLTGNYYQRGRDWERPAHMSFFDCKNPADDEPGHGFSQNIGLRIHGGATRRYPQKSLRLYARSDYDWNPDISYPLFPGHTQAATGEPLLNFKRLILRSSGDDWFHTMFKDALVQSLYSDRKVDRQAYRPSVVFINGEYWGIHNIRERYDDWYVSSHYGIDREDVVILVNDATVNTGRPSDHQHYSNMRREAAERDLSEEQHLAYIKTLMDVDNYLRYKALHVYAANADWPHNNIRYWRKRTDGYRPDAPYGADGRWRWMIFDLDASFGYPAYTGENDWWAEYDHNMIEWITGHGNPRVPSGWVNELFNGLIENERIRNRFISILADDLNTRYRPDFVEGRILTFRDRYEPLMMEHIARYPGSDRHPGTAGGSMEAWKDHIRIMTDFARERPAYLRQHLMDFFGMEESYELKITRTGAPTGFVRVNETDLSPNTPGVPEDYREWTGTYFGGVPVTLTPLPGEKERFIEWISEQNELLSRPDISESTDPDTGLPQLTWTPEDDLMLTARFEAQDVAADPDDELLPGPFVLSQNYPNPFNEQTVIPYKLTERADVVIDVYTANGRRIRTLTKGRQEPGRHELHFHAKGLATGLYLYRLTAIFDTHSKIQSPAKKMMLIR